MSHADDGQLNALLDGELSEREVRAVESHVAQCAECRRRLEEARSFLQQAGALLESLGPIAAQPAAPVGGAESARPVAPHSDVPAAAAAPPAFPAQPLRRIAKTAREVAVEIDGRTAKTPAIRPVFPDEVPPAAPSRRGWDLEKLAWAASIVLALGVGYLANESLRMHKVYNDLAAARQTQPPSQATALSNQRPAATPASAPRQVASVPAGARARREAVPALGGAGPRGDIASGSAALDKPRSGRVKTPAAHQARPTDIADVAGARPAQGAGVAPATAAPGALPSPSAPAGASYMGARAPAAPPQAATRGLASNRPAAVDEVSYRAAFGFQPITMVEAVRSLSGSIRQIDHMRLLGIGAAAGQFVSGADRTRDVVRLTYTDRLGRRFTLDQQLAEPRPGGGPAFSGIMPGDTLVTITADGNARVRWMDGRFWLSVTGAAPVDDVKAAVARVR